MCSGFKCAKPPPLAVLLLIGRVKHWKSRQHKLAEGAAGPHDARPQLGQADQGQRLLAQPVQDLPPVLLAQRPPGLALQQGVGGDLDV